jgi:hypothetical protein
MALKMGYAPWPGRSGVPVSRVVSGPRWRATMNKMAILLVICSYATMGRAFLVSSPLSGLQVVILMCQLF